MAESGPIPVRAAAIRAVSHLGQRNLEPWAQKIILSDAPNEVRTEAMRLLGGSVAGVTTSALLVGGRHGDCEPPLVAPPPLVEPAPPGPVFVLPPPVVF